MLCRSLWRDSLGPARGRVVALPSLLPPLLPFLLPLGLAVPFTVATGNPRLGAWLDRLGLLWVAHVGFDRMMGYGLKESSGFNDTHLGRIGRGTI